MADTYRFAFVMDQQVGLRTQSLDFERVVAADATIDPTWIPVPYEADPGPLKWLPGFLTGIKGTLSGVREIRDGMRGKQFDGVIWATWAAKSVPDILSRAPAFLRMDMTPIQMQEMGSLYGYGQGRARFLGGLKRRATNHLNALVEHHFPWSEFASESLRTEYGVPADRITVISPGVDTNLYRPNPEAKPSDGIVRLLFVGGDFARKGGDLLLRWAVERRKAGDLPTFEVHIVTRDEAVRSAPGLVVYRNIVNNSPELVRLYQQSDLFVLPTRADCYSLVGLEAMASGLPVVISRIGGIPDIVDDGKTGYLLPPNNYEKLATALDTLVCDPILRQSMGAAGRARAEAFFDNGACIGRVLEAMKQTARQRR